MNFKTFFLEQARKPSGLFGRWVMSKIFDHGNVAINDFMKELLSLKENDHILEIGFGTGKLILAFEDIEQLESRPLSTNVFRFYQPDEIITLLSRNGFSGSIDMISREIKSQRYHCAVAVK